MTDWLQPLRATLDAAAQPVPFFVRDDDAGWADDELWLLVDRTADAGLQLDLAVIPAAADCSLVGELNRRREHGSIAVHQHGWAHVNHEPVGRKCEFGPARDERDVAADLARGRAVMTDAFGTDAGAMFVPPWNRCSAQAARLLPELGYRALSRDSTAGRLDVAGLAEVPITVDWAAAARVKPGGGGTARDRRGELLAAAARAVGETAAAPAVGVMLHHAAMEPHDLDDVTALAEVVTGHPMAEPVLMTDLLAQPGS